MASYYTDVEVSAKIGKSIMAVWNMANRGELPSKRVDGKRVYPKYAIDSMLTVRQAAPNSPTKLSRKSNKSSPSNTTRHRGLTKTPDTSRSRYFTLEQVAFALQRTQTDIERMIRRKEIKTETINGRDWISKNEVERIISKRDPQRQARIRKRLPQPHDLSEQSRVKTSPSVISGTELVNAAQRFGISTNKIRQMIAEGELIQHPIEGHLVKAAHSEHSRATNASEIEGTSLSPSSGGNSHYNVREAAEKLDKSPDEVWEMVYKDKLSVSTVNGERVFPKQAVDNLIPETHPESIQSKSSQKSETRISQASEATLEEVLFAEGRYYTPAQAALLLGKDAFEIKRMIRREVLPVLRVNSYLWIPEQSVEDLLTESARRRWQDQENRPKAYRVRKSEIQKADAPERKGRDTEKNVNESESSVPLDSQQDASQVSSDSSQSPSETALEEVIEMLRDELQGERELNARLSAELEQAREEHQRDVRDARYEIDQLDAELENVRKDTSNSILGSKLKQERERRDEVEGWARRLEAELDKESVLSSKREQSFADMEAKLARIEAKNRELEQTLFSERERLRQMEEDVQILAEVRRVVAASTAQRSSELTAPPSTLPSQDNERNTVAHKEDVPELVLQTNHGAVHFRLPFPLDSQEEELLKLTAQWGEISESRLKQVTDRRRAADDLDDLLDRLEREGLEPVIKEEDRYVFDPKFVQDL